MSTFFEKLTGSRQKSPSADTANFAPEELPRRGQRPQPILREEPARSMHLKIETGEDPGSPEPDQGPDEEGELTVDIYDRGDDIVIQSTVAGVRPEDLDVSVTNDTVAIRGRRERMEETEEKNYYYKELFWGTFARSVILPEEIEEDMAEANLKHGLLTLRLPKRRKGVVQKLKVKTI